MKKYLLLILCFIFWLSGPVYADMELVNIVPEKHVAKVINDFGGLTGIQIKMSSKDLKSVITFVIPAKKNEENQKQFAERVMKSALLALLRLKALSDDRARFDSDMRNLSPPAGNIAGDEVKSGDEVQ